MDWIVLVTSFPGHWFSEEPVCSTVLIPMGIYFVVTHLKIYYLTFLSAPRSSTGPAHILNSSFVPHKTDAASEFTAVKATHMYTALIKLLSIAERICNSDYLFMDKQKLSIFKGRSIFRDQQILQESQRRKKEFN